MIFLKRESLLKKTAEEASQGMLVDISGVKLSGKRTEKGTAFWILCWKEKLSKKDGQDKRQKGDAHTILVLHRLFLILPDSWEEWHNTYFIYSKESKMEGG